MENTRETVSPPASAGWVPTFLRRLLFLVTVAVMISSLDAVNGPSADERLLGVRRF